GKTELAIVGDYAVVADTREELEAVGKYVMFRAATGNKLPHDVALRIPFDKFGAPLQKLAADAWAKVPASSIPASLKATLDSMIPGALAVVADMGELSVDADVDGKVLKMAARQTAKGEYGAFLGKWPQGDANALLSLPKADGGSFL